VINVKEDASNAFSIFFINSSYYFCPFLHPIFLEHRFFWVAGTKQLEEPNPPNSDRSTGINTDPITLSSVNVLVLPPTTCHSETKIKNCLDLLYTASSQGDSAVISVGGKPVTLVPFHFFGSNTSNSHKNKGTRVFLDVTTEFLNTTFTYQAVGAVTTTTKGHGSRVLFSFCSVQNKDSQQQSVLLQILYARNDPNSIDLVIYDLCKESCYLQSLSSFIAENYCLPDTPILKVLILVYVIYLFMPSFISTYSKKFDVNTYFFPNFTGG
jgi:hypothetical protein